MKSRHLTAGIKYFDIRDHDLAEQIAEPFKGDIYHPSSAVEFDRSTEHVRPIPNQDPRVLVGSKDQDLAIGIVNVFRRRIPGCPAGRRDSSRSRAVPAKSEDA